MLHQRELAAAHVSAIDLKQEGIAVAPGRKPHAIGKQAAVAAVGRVPQRIAPCGCENLALWVAI
jgi:hypothetical protein